MHVLANFIAIVASLVALAGIGYLIVASFCVWRFAALGQEESPALPGITILKPLYGAERGLYENLRSFCTQAYPEFQVVFCVHDATDPAAAIAQRLIDEFPERNLTLVLKGDFEAPNPKVTNLAAGLERAQHDLLVIADSDVRATPDCLRAIAAAFSDDAVGAASCLYRGNSRGDLPSALGALHINGHFAPSVIVATAMEPVRFCLGATMAVRRTVLQEIGGLSTLGKHLGDDYMLGALAAQHGYTVKVIPHVVSCMVSEASLTANFVHQLRWARTIRHQRPLGFSFLFVTLPLPFALIALAAAMASPWAIAIFVATLAARYALHVSCRNALALCDRGSARIVPLADLIELCVWVCAFFGNAVNWRAQEYRVGIEGRVK